MASSGVGPATSSAMKSSDGRSDGARGHILGAVGKASNKSRAVLNRSLCDMLRRGPLPSILSCQP